MAFHLEGPWLSKNGKFKGKKKFRSAEAKSKSEQLDKDWEELQKKWGVEQDTKKRNRALTADTYKPPAPTHRGASSPKINSLDTGAVPCVKAPDKVYTGTAMKGVATMHKSNSVPVFDDQHLVDIANMRRNDYTRDVKQKPIDDAGILPPSDQL